MKKIFSVLILILSLSMLFACSDSDLPEGMQLVKGGEDVGYYFYAPEEWTLSNYGQISAAYASNVDSSSISFTYIGEPEGTIDEYFTKSLDEFPVRPNVTVSGEETTFGNADKAVKYVFEHEYTEHKFRTMQIFVSYEDRFGIFTYNSMLENVSSSEELQYDFYKEKIQSVIDNFLFVKMSGTQDTDAPELIDGYKLISDPSIAKFSFYVPEAMKVDEASGIVTASFADGSNLSLSRATATGVVVSEYWETRKAELSGIVTDLQEIEVNKEASLGNSKRAFSYEYTFVYNNTKYHVYQVLAVTTFDGFVYTYTATESNYSTHLDDVKAIAGKVEF